ncbi:hypothetical protein MJC1_04153 [Methylocystis sp. MJC1]|nr:hypothetical protein MJC1_04153 [Methylocystis sp. MJC1]
MLGRRGAGCTTLSADKPGRPTGPAALPVRALNTDRRAGETAGAAGEAAPVVVVVHVPALRFGFSQLFVEWQQPQSAVVFGWSLGLPRAPWLVKDPLWQLSQRIDVTDP